jgi:cytochrome c
MRTAAVIWLCTLIASNAAAAEGDARRGRQLFQRACGACHSLKPDANMTGPSLSGVWRRKAGGLPSFTRYSPAIKKSQLTWDDSTLSAWIENPAALIPGNRMTFPGLKDAQARTDLLAFLRERTAPGQAAEAEQDGGMGGMMGGGAAPNLRQLTPDQRVTAITHCKDTYTVKTSDGQTMDYWERNLRFKTDTSEIGPAKGTPAIIGAGMAGDRASVIFSAPEEISAWIKPSC